MSREIGCGYMAAPHGSGHMGAGGVVVRRWRLGQVSRRELQLSISSKMLVPNLWCCSSRAHFSHWENWTMMDDSGKRYLEYKANVH